MTVEKLKSTVKTDDITKKISEMMDYSFDGITEFDVPQMPMKNDFSIGLIVGPSGSGKSTLLKKYGTQEVANWHKDMAIVSHFDSAEDAQERLAAVGLNSIPSWLKPYHVLSTGEKFRADLAAVIKDNSVVDEFTSVVDRSVAKSCSSAISRYIRKKNIKGVVFATCHYDVIDWLNPDWIYDTATDKMVARGCERRPKIELDLLPCGVDAWAMFSKHHYLSGDINKSSRCWLAVWDGTPIGFASAVAYPSGTVKNAWRGHRTVVLPDYQGIGIGVRISDAVGEIFIKSGCRYFSKTAHPRLGAYRNCSDLWKPTSKNMKSRQDYNSTRKTKEDKHKIAHKDRVCFSHEYIGRI